MSYADHKLRSRETLFASFISFTFSNNLGFALVSRSSVRYWIYTGFGLHPVEIGEVVAFCTLTYALGVTTVGGLMLLFDPAGMSSILNLPQPLLLAAGIAMLSVGGLPRRSRRPARADRSVALSTAATLGRVRVWLPGLGDQSGVKRKVHGPASNPGEPR